MALVAVTEDKYIRTHPNVLNQGATVFQYEPSQFENNLARQLHQIEPGGTRGATEVLAESADATYPVLALSRLGAVKTLSFYISMTANNETAEDWQLHVIPYFESDLIAENQLHAIGPGQYDTASLLFTHSTSSAGEGETEIHLSQGFDEFVVGGGGTGVLASEVGQTILVAPYLGLEFRAVGTQTAYTINNIAVWGNYRRIG